VTTVKGEMFQMVMFWDGLFALNIPSRLEGVYKLPVRLNVQDTKHLPNCKTKTSDGYCQQTQSGTLHQQSQGICETGKTELKTAMQSVCLYRPKQVIKTSFMVGNVVKILSQPSSHSLKENQNHGKCAWLFIFCGRFRDKPPSTI